MGDEVTCENCGHTPKPSASVRILARAEDGLKNSGWWRSDLPDAYVHFYALAFAIAVRELDALEAQQAT